MKNEINGKLEVSEAITSILDKKSFVNLSPDLQNKIIDTVHNNVEKGGGIMGKFLGTKQTNVAMHIGLIICVILLLIVIVECIHSYFVKDSINMDLVSAILPIITLFLGYIFGRGSN